MEAPTELVFNAQMYDYTDPGQWRVFVVVREDAGENTVQRRVARKSEELGSKKKDFGRRKILEEEDESSSPFALYAVTGLAGCARNDSPESCEPRAELQGVQPAGFTPTVSVRAGFRGASRFSSGRSDLSRKDFGYHHLPKNAASPGKVPSESGLGRRRRSPSLLPVGEVAEGDRSTRIELTLSKEKEKTQTGGGGSPPVVAEILVLDANAPHWLPVENSALAENLWA